MLPKKFEKDYLTQKMAMKIGRKLDRNKYYRSEEHLHWLIGRLLIEPIEKESGRGLPDVLNYIKQLDLSEFAKNCKPFAKW